MELENEEYVVYKSFGVCQMLGIQTQNMDGEHEIPYYKLKPLTDLNSTYYVPVTAAKEKLRRLMQKNEVLALISDMPVCDDAVDSIWSDNRKERRETYARILKSDDHSAMMKLISSLYFKKQSSEADGKYFSDMDKSAMENAERLMIQEFGIVLHMTSEEVKDFLAAESEKKHAY
jgi:RNA polymerase-interacting CarD/CdnL/TRCF family regulator